jgi:regulator of protease activity HflC (stomatin/prohibitin superfamily)
MGRIIGAAFAAIITLLAITVVFGSWFTVDQGERGVLLRNGAVTGTASPGLGFKTPWIEDVEYISVQSKARLYEEMQAYSYDQQPATMKVSVNYRILPDKVEEVYSLYGGEEGLVTRVVDRRVQQQVKNVFGKFNAITAIQQRERLNDDVQTALQSSVVGPLLIESVQIENIDFSDAYEQSVEQRMLAEVEVQKLRQNAEREKVQAEIVVTQANAKADAVRQAAMAEAEAIKLRGDAEAQAIKARGDALAANPSLVSLVQAERWNGQLPTTMLPNSTVPFISAGKTNPQ